MRAFDAVIGVALALTSAGAGAARAADAVSTIVAPDTVRPGSVVRIDLVALNPGFADQMRFDVRPTLGATFATATGSFPVTLTATSEGPMSLEPRGFAARAYSMTVPDAPEGRATLRVDAGEREVAATMLVVRDEGAEPRTGADRAGDPLTTAPASTTFPRTLPGRLAIHQPNYFVYGPGKEPAAKFQFSIKYRLLTFGGPDHESPSLQLAYTQRSLWDLRESSQPFYDTSYMPELFVESLRPATERRRRLSFLGWAAGYRHESNGKDGDDSRGCDVVYARAGLAGGSTAAWYFAVVPEIWQYVGSIDHMPDLEEYRGHGKLQLVVGHGAGPGLAWSVSPADGFRRVTHQVDLSIPIGVRKLDLGTYFVMQYFDGYAESLLDYTHASRTVRAGLAIVR